MRSCSTPLLAGVLLATVPAAVPAQHVHPSADTAAVAAPLGISMDRMGSGTTWIPDAASLPSRHFRAGSWSLMLHGFAFGQYMRQGGPRGDDQLGSLNWAMLMASRTVAGGRLQLRTMLSLDPGTVTARGYPLLLQTGETYEDEPLHDRQHPHDFWMELGLLYERQVSDGLGVAFYAAPSGEPALGPVAFMHRPSAMDDPVAPLGHHWQDATHTSFGVLTLGVFGYRWKLEGSLFNGREPDEHRWDFDSIRLDSFGARLTVNPSERWSLSTAYGFLKSPEAHEPDESAHRVTASAMYGAPLGHEGQLAATVVYGVNRMSGHLEPAEWSHTFLVEAEAVFDGRHTLFGRAEWVRKTGEDLVLPDPALHQHFHLGSLSVGAVRELGSGLGLTLGLGLRGTLNVLPSSLVPYYGSRTPLGGMVFLRVRPVRDAHAGMRM
ncbi:MAG TPA: hypothetical protein VIQ98_10350 [Gemmatimonadales bacterium]